MELAPVLRIYNISGMVFETVDSLPINITNFTLLGYVIQAFIDTVIKFVFTNKTQEQWKYYLSKVPLASKPTWAIFS